MEPLEPAYLYNITMLVAGAAETAWLNWVKQTHIPAIMATGCFESYRLVRLMGVDETDGPTYALQLTTAGKAQFDRYVTEFEPMHQQQEKSKWGETMLRFSTLMQVVH